MKLNHFPIEVKDSIILRPYTKADADIVFHTVNENREHLLGTLVPMGGGDTENKRHSRVFDLC